MSQTFVYSGHHSPSSTVSSIKHQHRISLQSPMSQRAQEISLRKRNDREAILAAHESWRLPFAVPPPERDLDGQHKDVLALPLTHLTAEEREIVHCDATSLVQRLAQGKWTAVQVLTAFSKAAIVAQDVCNCLTEIFIEEGLKRAKELDEHFQKTGKTVGPLHGLPVSIKDHILLRGRDTSTGYIAWAYNTVAEKDAVVVDILRRSGAVFYVKTANPQTLLALETNNNIYGRTWNPFNRTLAPGGSSGGESALISCHGSPMGVGTDIGGSIRIPAGWTGLYGLKGSVGRLPHAGLLGSHDGMDNIIGCVGPLARSARDLDLFCRVMSQAEPWLVEHQVLEMPWKPLDEIVLPERLCFAVLWDDGVVRPHPPILNAMSQVKEALIGAGHEVIDWIPMDHQGAWDLINKLYLLDAGEEYYETMRDDPPVPTSEWILSHAKGRKPYTVAETWRLNVQRDAFRARGMDHWNATKARTSTGRAVDAIVCPVAATLAPPHDTTKWWGYSSYWNLLDYPCVVHPIGRFSAAEDRKGAHDKKTGTQEVPYGEDAGAGLLREPRNEVEAFVRGQWDPETYDNAPINLQLVGRRLNEEKLLKMLGVVEGALFRK